MERLYNLFMTTEELADLLKGTHKGPSVRFKGFSIDSRQVEQGQIFVALKGQNHDGHSFASDAIKKGAVGVIAERALDLPEEAAQVVVENSLEALRKIASFKRENFMGRVIAVAGSAGKTTTKEMIAFLLSRVGKVCKTPRNFNSQVGVPLSIANFEDDCDFWVVEMGASQKGEVKRLVEVVRPHIRVITAIGEEHLETFGCLDDVVLGNGEVFHMMADGDWAICPEHVSHCYEAPNKLTFGHGSFGACDVSLDPEGVSFSLKGERIFVPVPSLAIVENALCAFRTLEALGYDWRDFLGELSSFHPVEGRFRVFRKGELILIDDTYNANPPSMRMALRSLSLFDGFRVAVLGDMLELGERSEDFHREIGHICANSGIDLCLFYGRMMTYAWEECIKNGGNCMILDGSSLLTFISSKVDGKTVILLKGSRGMKMEKFVEEVIQWVSL